MKKIKLLFIFVMLFVFMPLVKADNVDLVNKEDNTDNVQKLEYRDVVANIVGIEPSEKVTIYLFHSNSCSHCREEIEFLKTIEKKYDVVIKKYEVGSDTNSSYMKKAKNSFLVAGEGVPFTVIGTKHFVGYGEYVGIEMEKVIEAYINNMELDSSTKTLPLIGEINVKNVSIPLVAIILGFIDGFNPCAMWILLFLINMLFNMKNRKRMWILGITFLITSAFIYFLAMLGINTLFGIFNTKILKILIALVALTGGILNIRSYLKIRKDDGCHVIDSKKRTKYFDKIKKFTTEKSFILSLIGVITLAASVNIVELACSAGFPTIFVEILDINNLSSLQDIMYILLYILFYLIDDIIVFSIAMVTLKITGISTKYNKFSHLIGGIIMILIGLLLIFKPEWLMFNFN